MVELFVWLLNTLIASVGIVCGIGLIILGMPFYLLKLFGLIDNKETHYIDALRRLNKDEYLLLRSTKEEDEITIKEYEANLKKGNVKTQVSSILRTLGFLIVFICICIGIVGILFILIFGY